MLQYNHSTNCSQATRCYLEFQHHYCILLNIPYFSYLQETSPFGIGEIKCPFSKKDTCIEQACEDPNFFLGLSNGKVSLKRKHVPWIYLSDHCLTLVQFVCLLRSARFILHNNILNYLLLIFIYSELCIYNLKLFYLQTTQLFKMFSKLSQKLQMLFKV